MALICAHILSHVLYWGIFCTARVRHFLMPRLATTQQALVLTTNSHPLVRFGVVGENWKCFCCSHRVFRGATSGSR
jgi:hypothetical protein